MIMPITIKNPFHPVLGKFVSLVVFDPPLLFEELLIVLVV